MPVLDIAAQTEAYRLVFKELYEILPPETKVEVDAFRCNPDLSQSPDAQSFFQRVIAKAEKLVDDTAQNKTLNNVDTAPKS